MFQCFDFRDSDIDQRVITTPSKKDNITIDKS